MTGGAEAAAAADTLWPHTKILLGKNLKLKRQQYLIPTKMFKLPVPLSATVEFVLPLAIVILLTYIKTLTDIDVFPQGWGGDVPQGILDINTECVNGIDYRWKRATRPDEDRTSSCRPYTDTVRSIEPFFRTLTHLHALQHVKVAFAAESPEDAPKVRRMREWISREWYPRQELDDVPCMAGELIAGDIGWDEDSFDEASLQGSVRNCTHHGVNPGVLSSFEDVSHIQGGGTAAELQEYIESDGYMVSGPRVWAAVVFNAIPGEGNPGEDGHWNYSVRMNFTHADITSTYLSPTRHFSRGIQTYYALQYGLDGFSTLQLLVDRYIINRRTETNAALVLANNGFDKFEVDPRYTIDLISAWTPEALEQAAEPMRYEPQIVNVLPVPSVGHRRNLFYSVVKQIFALLYVLLFMYSVFSIIATLVEEKETRVRELLRMMSVQTPSLVLSWYITYGAVFLGLNFLLTTSSTIGWGVGVFASTSSSVIFVFFFLFSMSSIGYAYMVHTFFDQAKTGGVVGMLGFFSSYFLYTAFRSEETSSYIKQSISFFSPCAFAYGIDAIMEFEEVEVGVSWSNIDEKVKGVSMMDAMTSMFIDAILYSLLGLYLEQVLPKQYGARRHPLFPLEWCGLRKPQVEGSAASSASAAADSGSGVPQPSPDSFEAVNLPNVQQLESEGKCVKLKRLRKTFSTPDGEKIAVHALDMTLYEGQIFVLLGHNGAGKTTTINMLTGLYEPTSGDAEVYGRSIVNDMMGVRRLIGICPQHDVLFLTLTVSEHLYFYAALRGVPEAQQDAVVTQKIAQVGLTEKANVRAGSLSGGMKRKLSLAISLVGDSKAVFLDEPTSGMDPYSRRSTWNTLQSEKDGRVMILTTHFMEEADLLGDRIGIMAEGELRCCGSPLFLKRRFGQGYTLSITRNNSCVVKTLQDTVTRLIPGAVLTSAVGTEVMFKLPVEAVDSFPLLLKKLDEDSSLGVDQTGVSITTMEEVFCNIAAENDTANQDAMLTDSGENASNNLHRRPTQTASSKIEAMTPNQVFMLHFKAMFMKRWQYGKRDHVSIAFTTILPVCMLFAGLLLLKYGEVDGSFGNQPLRPLVLSQFNENCEETHSCDKPDTRVPFLVASDRHGEHPGRTTEVESRLQAQPWLEPMPVQYDDTLETGMQWLYGIQYEDGLPSCDTPAYRPRADMSDWTDPRHRFFAEQSKLPDPGVCLAFSEQVFGLGDGTDYKTTGVIYGSLLFHDVLQQSSRDICHMPSVVGAPNGVVSGGAVSGISCTMSLQAQPGMTVQVKVTESNLRSNSVSVYNSTSIDPENLVAVLSSRDDLGMVIASSSGVLTFVETVKHERPERWSVYWSSVAACVDADPSCSQVIDQIAAFGFDCDTRLDDVDPDTIEYPPIDARTGEPIVLPRNPVTGQDFTEAELRQLASLYLPQLRQQYGGRSLAEYCPVSCVEEVCGDRHYCWSENRCGETDISACTFTASAINTAPFQCSANELVNEAAVGGCRVTQAQADFCSSTCFAAVGPWLAHCTDESYDVLNEVYADSVANWFTLSAVLRVANAAQCDTSNLHSPDDETPQPGGVTLIFNSTARHGVGTFLNIANNVLREPLDARTAAGSAAENLISVNNHPLPFTSHQAGLLDAVKSLQAVLFIMIAFAFVPGGIVVFVVREKEAHHNSKHQQMISGASIVSFWLSSYAFDLLTYMIPLTLSILSIIWVDLDQLVDNGALWACFVLLLGYGLSVTSCTYALSFLFDKHTQAQIIVVLFNVFLGLVLMIAQFVMAQIEDTQYVNELLMPLYRLSPGFCLGHGLFTLTSSSLLAQFLDNGDDSGGGAMSYSPLSLMIAGTDCIFLYGLAIFYMLLTIAIDTLQSRPKYAARFASEELKEVKVRKKTPLFEPFLY